MVLHMLSTIDNPFNPWTEFDEWRTFDERMGYQTPGLLARLVKNSSQLSEADQDLEMENVIDEIVRINVTGLYVKVPDPKGS